MQDGQPVDFKKLTVGELRDFKDYVEGLAEIGRKQRKLYLKGEKLTERRC